MGALVGLGDRRYRVVSQPFLDVHSYRVRYGVQRCAVTGVATAVVLSRVIFRRLRVLPLLIIPGGRQPRFGSGACMGSAASSTTRPAAAPRLYLFSRVCRWRVNFVWFKCLCRGMLGDAVEKIAFVCDAHVLEAVFEIR